MFVRKYCDFSLSRILYGLPTTMRKDLLSATGKVVVKDRKQDLNAFFTVYLRSRKFEISCCDIHAYVIDRSQGQ